MSGYELSEIFFDWSFENPEKVTPNHVALYFFIIEHSNRLGWKEKFGLPTEMTKEAIGVKSYKTYQKTLSELIEFGFIKMIEKSKNQYSSNIIALVKNTKAHTKARTKARLKHVLKQVESKDSIDKPNNTEPNNTINNIIPNYDVFSDYAKTKRPKICLQALKLKYDIWIESDWHDGHGVKIINWKTKLLNTLPYLPDVKTLSKNPTAGAI